MCLEMLGWSDRHILRQFAISYSNVRCVDLTFAHVQVEILPDASKAVQSGLANLSRISHYRDSLV